MARGGTTPKPSRGTVTRSRTSKGNPVNTGGSSRGRGVVRGGGSGRLNAGLMREMPDQDGDTLEIAGSSKSQNVDAAIRSSLEVGRTERTQPLARKSTCHAPADRNSASSASKKPAAKTPRSTAAKKSRGTTAVATPQAKKTKKPHRYWPRTDALRETLRDDPMTTRDELLDKSYRPSIVPFVEPNARQTRYQSRVYFKIADNLPVIEVTSTPDEEEKTFTQFKKSVEKEKLTTKRELTNGLAYESDKAIWVSTIVRYKHRKMRAQTLKYNEKTEYWTKNNGCVSSVARNVKKLMKQQSKPIVVVVGQQQFRTFFGHCVTVMFMKSNGEWLVYCKDSLECEETACKMFVYYLVAEVGLRLIRLVGVLDTEEAVLHTECLREAYKVVANALDGDFIWNYKLEGFIDYYDAISKKKIIKK